MKLELTEINEILRQVLQDKRSLKKVNVEIDNFEQSLQQGETNSLIEIFEVTTNIYVKIVMTSDSYGTIDGIESIAFVKPVKKEIIVYENV